MIQQYPTYPIYILVRDKMQAYFIQVIGLSLLRLYPTYTPTHAIYILVRDKMQAYFIQVTE